MNSRQLMHSVLEGRKGDAIPVAPYFWCAEYAWKLTGKPLWEVLFSPPDRGIGLLSALDTRHGADWVLAVFDGSGWLRGKRLLGEEPDKVLFLDEATKEEWVFHKEGHWLGRKGEEQSVCNAGWGKDPPRSKAEADAWLDTFISQPEARLPLMADTALRSAFPERFLTGPMPAPFAFLAYNLGFETSLLLLSENPSLAAYMAERIMGDVDYLAQQLKANDFDAGLMCDSWASADIMSPETYRNWIAPLHKQISDALHAAGLKSIVWNTGNVLPMLDTIAAMNYDAISVEERIKGVEMDIVEIRKQIGSEICLFGNFDAYLLLSGDRDKIRSEVQRQMKAANGPFIMGTGSPICDGTEPDVIDYWISLVRGVSTER